jgi:hypothetical protein
VLTGSVAADTVGVELRWRLRQCAALATKKCCLRGHLLPAVTLRVGCVVAPPPHNPAHVMA